MTLRKLIGGYFTVLLLATLWLFMGNSCGDNILTDPRNLIFPDSAVSYQAHVQPLWNLSCTFSGCHNSNDRAGGVSLATYFDMMSRPGLVIINNPQASILTQLLRGQLPHPLVFQARITQNHIQGVETWIREGAKNN